MSLGKKKIQHQAAGAAVVNTENFAPKLYTGNGSTQSITGVGFAPDLVYIKCRTDTFAPVMFDTVRGTTKALWTSENYAQQNDSDTITSFDSDGFTTGDDNKTNRSSQNYVAWCWNAGGTEVSNTDGSLTTTVRANVDAGFSIIQYTDDGSTNTIGHGLSSAPELWIVKKKTGAQDWYVGSTEIAATQAIRLNLTNAAYTTGGWQNTYPTDSVININIDTGDYICYAFHSVDGYQKIGSYTGNGTANKEITGLGFAPRFVMIKNLSDVGSWIIHDKARSPSNPSTIHLRANTSGADDSGANERIDFDSDGFTLVGTGQNINHSDGDTYMYLAIA
jgi:hypothetical protein